MAEAECWKKHLSTAFESDIDGTVNKAFTQMIEGNGGDSSENSGSANVADIVDGTMQQQKPLEDGIEEGIRIQT